MECYSHPDRKLRDHLESVKKIGLQIFDSKNNLKFSFKTEEIRKCLEIVLYYHDIGKATKYFQEYLEATLEGKKCNHKQDLINHALLSACIASYFVKKQTQNDFLSAMSFALVRKHHGNFENFDDMIITKKGDILKKQFESIDVLDFPELNNLCFNDIYIIIEDLFWVEIQQNIENYFLFNFLFSILIYSDKNDVIIGKTKFFDFPDKIESFVDNYKKAKFKIDNSHILNKIRNKIYVISLKELDINYNQHNIFSLNVPTGTGKTLTALNLAFNLLKKKKFHRIIYALPFTSIVDQTEKILQEILELHDLISENYFIVHHHLTEAKIKTDENIINGDKAQFLIENWDRPIILTTFWQLFYSIISNKNSQLRKFHNLANSVIILDEVQTLPYKYWGLTKEVFKILTRILNSKIVFLTATMPLIFNEEQKEIMPLVPKQKRKEYFSFFSRYNLKILKNNSEIASFSIDDLFNEVKNDIIKNKDKSYLFVFNTINSSIEFYNKLKDEFNDREIIYLSTNILPLERKKRIDIIKNNSFGKIVVSTQLIEAGVDIDLDIVYRDFAPLDSIIQTAGRCNRNNKKNDGNVVIFKLKNENEKYYYSYIYSGLSLVETENLFREKNIYPESELIDLINKYYYALKDKSSQDESRKILDSIKALKYEDILSQFKLIEEIPSFLMFFEINKRATELLQTFRDILNIKDRYNRKNEFLKIKSQFYEYILSVKFSETTKSYFTSFEDIGNIKIVDNTIVDNIYDKNTGLKRAWSIFL